MSGSRRKDHEESVERYARLDQLEARLAEAEEAALREARLHQEAERRLAEALRELEKLEQ